MSHHPDPAYLITADPRLGELGKALDALYRRKDQASRSRPDDFENLGARFAYFSQEAETLLLDGDKDSEAWQSKTRDLLSKFDTLFPSETSLAPTPAQKAANTFIRCAKKISRLEHKRETILINMAVGSTASSEDACTALATTLNTASLTFLSGYGPLEERRAPSGRTLRRLKTQPVVHRKKDIVTLTVQHMNLIKELFREVPEYGRLTPSALEEASTDQLVCALIAWSETGIRVFELRDLVTKLLRHDKLRAGILNTESIVSVHLHTAPHEGHTVQLGEASSLEKVRRHFPQLLDPATPTSSASFVVRTRNGEHGL